MSDELPDIVARVLNARNRVDLRLEDAHRLAQVCRILTSGGAVGGWRERVPDDRGAAGLTGAWPVPVRWLPWASQQYCDRKGSEGRWQRSSERQGNPGVLRWENCEPPVLVKDVTATQGTGESS